MRSLATSGSCGPVEAPQLKQTQLGALGLAERGAKSIEVGERAKALPDLTHLRLVVLDVLVRPLGIPQARELRVLVDGHVHSAARDVERHPVSRLHRAA